MGDGRRQCTLLGRRRRTRRRVVGIRAAGREERRHQATSAIRIAPPRILLNVTISPVFSRRSRSDFVHITGTRAKYSVAGTSRPSSRRRRSRTIAGAGRLGASEPHTTAIPPSHSTVTRPGVPPKRPRETCARITRSRSPRNRKCAFGYGSDWARTNNSMSAALAVKSIRDSRSERLWKYVARAGSCW